MPLTAQMLYILLIMEADNFGFLNNAKSVMETNHASENDLDILVKKEFLMKFPSGVYCIKHWFMMNRQDKRLQPTYGEYELVTIKNNQYVFRDDRHFPDEGDW